MSIGREQRLWILWSHNEQTYPDWLMIAAKVFNLQGYVWWDVGWNIKADQFTFPVTGYICHRGKITHMALLQSIEVTHQPNKGLANKVANNFKQLYKLSIYRPPYDENLTPLNKFLNGEKKAPLLC